MQRCSCTHTHTHTETGTCMCAWPAMDFNLRVPRNHKPHKNHNWISFFLLPRHALYLPYQHVCVCVCDALALSLPLRVFLHISLAATLSRSSSLSASRVVSLLTQFPRRAATGQEAGVRGGKEAGATLWLLLSLFLSLLNPFYSLRRTGFHF